MRFKNILTCSEFSLSGKLPVINKQWMDLDAGFLGHHSH